MAPLLRRPPGNISATTVQQLPDDVLLQIFSYFPLKGICLIISPVCLRWSQLSKHPSFWTVLEFDSQRKVNPKIIVEILRRSTLLKELTLKHFDSSQMANVIGKNSTLLENLTFEKCRIFFKSFKKLIEGCPKIVNLCINNCEGDSGKEFELISKLNNLREFKVAATAYFSESALIKMAKDCMKLEHISLDILSYNLDGHTVQEILRYREASLKTLYLDNDRLTDLSLSGIGKCSQLTKFHMNDANEITDSTLHELTHLTNLVELRIVWGRNLTSDGFVRMFSSRAMRNLVQLDLEQCQAVNDVVLRSISSCCCDSLSWLSLQLCRGVTPIGIREFVEMCSRLKHLDLKDTNLDFRSFELVDVLSLLPDLSYLDFVGCSVDNEDVFNEIGLLKPDLVIRIQEIIFV